MNLIREYKRSGISAEGDKKINSLRACVMGSYLENHEKIKLLKLIDDLEKYLKEDSF